MIGTLKSGMKNITIVGRVIRSETMPTRYTSLTKATIEDETGKIILNLWRSQTTQCKVGDLVKVKNGFVRSRMGSKELSTWSDIEVLSE